MQIICIIHKVFVSSRSNKSNTMKAIYIAGKLNDDAVGYLHNVHKMMTVAEEARLAGFAPFVPAIDLLMGIKFGYSKYEDYFDSSQAWLIRSDAVLLVEGWQTSKGTRLEIDTARDHGIPIFESLYEMVAYFNGDKVE